MASGWGFPGWRGREHGHRKGNPVVVTMESPDFSVVEIADPDEAFRPVEKSRNKNAKQVTWVLLLKANYAVGCVAWVTGAACSWLGTVKRRLIFEEGVAVDSHRLGKGRVLFQVIRGFLFALLIILAFEVMAYTKGWHYFEHTNLRIPSTSDVHSLLHLVYIAWVTFRANYVAPLIQALSKFCVVLFLIQSLDRMMLCLGCLWIKYKKIRPGIEGQLLADAEGSRFEFSMVLVQIPMCNEREV
ncbi:hypothetical protein MLD38_014116 [Melastoma candidum]|nr:hypothetical protein MLD38_014116 [Melastoma candidum]